VAALARQYGVQLRDLTGKRPAAVYRQLQLGRPVMVWVGLQDGPYGHWRTPAGRSVEVNFGEHAVVLTGIRMRDHLLSVANPLEGTADRWTRQEFEVMWKRLRRRALAPRTGS
jgi:uncharacterized protein YvpB